jgi:hypothetical protein
MFHGALCYYESDPWFGVLDEEFGENHIWPGKHLVKWNGMSDRERGLWLTGKLWNDRGIMPSDLCNTIELPQGSSYARGARKLRNDSWQELLPHSRTAA